MTPRLAELHLPLLFVWGELDQAPPETTRAYAAEAPAAEVVVIARAAQVASHARPEEYLRALRRWMDGRGP